jgi:hypothetical protein
MNSRRGRSTVITFRSIQDQKNFRSAVVAGIDDAGQIEQWFEAPNKNTAATVVSREQIVYACMRSLRERL